MDSFVVDEFVIGPKGHNERRVHQPQQWIRKW